MDSSGTPATLKQNDVRKIRYVFIPLLSLLLLIFADHSAFCQSKQLLLTEEFDHTPMNEVLEVLSDKYQLKISYEHIALEGVFVDQVFSGLPLDYALERIFQNTDLVYQVLRSDEVLIRKKSARTNPAEILLISGRVTDGLSGEGLAYATVAFGPNKGMETAESGFFSLHFPVSDPPESLTFYYLGYEPRVVPIEQVRPSEDLAVKMVPKTQEIKAVTITEKEPLFSQRDKLSGAMTFNMTKLNTLPSFVGGKDPIRALQFLPGISAHDDLSSELKVRGGNGDENLIIMDGIPLFNMTHYFGIFSMINPGVVDQVTVYKNVFPIEHGGRTASVVDISSHPFENRSVSGSAEVNLLTSNAHLEIPFSSKVGLMIGGRITNKNVANTSLFRPLEQDTRAIDFSNSSENNRIENELTGLDPNFQFYDFNAKLTWLVGEKTKLMASFFTGYDQFDYDLLQEKERFVRPPDTILFEESANWTNIGLSVRLNHQWSPSFTTNLSLSASEYNSQNSVTSFFTRFNIEQRQYNSIDIYNENSNEVRGLDLKIKNDWLLSEQQLLTFGAHFVNNETNSRFRIEDRDIFTADQLGQQYALFANYRATIADVFEFSLGLRPTYFTITEKVYLSPRASVGVVLNEQWRLKASWSLYHQFLRESIHENRLGRNYEFWLLPNDQEIPLSSSRQMMTGFTWTHDLFELDVELYHKKMTGVMEHALVINGFEQGQGGPRQFTQYKIFEGSGQSVGMDLLLKKMSGNYTGWLAYTLSKTTQQFPEIQNNVVFPSPDDRRHQFKWINQYRIGRWDLSLAYVFSSGAPYTDLSTLALEPRDRRSTDPNDRIKYLDDYHRIDVGAYYHFPVFGARGELGFSVFNLLNRKNVKYRQYLYAIPNNNGNTNTRLIGTELQMLGITPNVSLKVSFGK